MRVEGGGRSVSSINQRSIRSGADFVLKAWAPRRQIEELGLSRFGYTPNRDEMSDYIPISAPR